MTRNPWLAGRAGGLLAMTRQPRLWLVALFLALCAVTVIWVSLDRRPPEWDHANHLERALDCHRILAEPGHERFREIMEASSFYPPVVTCAAGLLYFVFPVVPLTAQAVLLGFLAVGLAAVFGLGRRLLDTEAGLLAAFFLGTAPFVIFSLTNFQLDLPLMAMVALALYALVRTETFALTGWSVGLGLALGLGMLTKPPFAVYVLPPLLWVSWLIVRETDGGRRLGRLLLTVAVGATVALPWYGPRLLGLPMQILNRSFKQAAESGHAEALTSTALAFYPRVFVPQFGLLAVLLFAGGLWALRKERARVFLWLAALAPFLLFSVIQNKNLRYTLPLLPAAAVVAAAGARALPRGLRTVVILGCIGMGALQVSMAAFSAPVPPYLPLIGAPLAIAKPPDPRSWPHDPILTDLAGEAGGRPVTVAVVPNDNYFSVSNFRYEAKRRGLPYRMTRAWGQAPLGVDFVILKTGSQGPSFSVEKPERIMKAFAGGDPYLASAFPVIGEYPLPDGSRGLLRARQIPPLRDGRPAEVAQRLEQAPERFLAANLWEPVGLTVRAEYRPDAILEGRVDRLLVEAESALVGEFSRKDRAPLRVRDLRLVAEDLLIHPQRLMDTGALQVLDVGAVRLERLTVTEADLREFLKGQPAGTGMTVTLTEGTADVVVNRFGPAIEARVWLFPGDGGSPFTLGVSDVSIGSVPVPGALVNWIARHFDPTTRLERLPVPVAVEAIRITPGRLQIGGSGG